MITGDHRYVLSYNGEIYNYREIRSELEALGYWFRSQTDSEVVLNALAHWGPDALLKFNGMFGLALWDRKEQTLLLARDRYGIKPLYYARQGHCFAFGSEQKAISAQEHNVLDNMLMRREAQEEEDAKRVADSDFAELDNLRARAHELKEAGAGEYDYQRAWEEAQAARAANEAELKKAYLVDDDLGPDMPLQQPFELPILRPIPHGSVGEELELLEERREMYLKAKLAEREHEQELVVKSLRRMSYRCWRR
jgi:asparagine synthetase B (glutamine-hydrolysing)